jgi:hypothetical protein
MEVVGAVIFFGGLLSLAGLVIYSGLKERKPDLILPLNGDELRIFKPRNGWVHIYRVNKGKVEAPGKRILVRRNSSRFFMKPE